MSSGGRGRPVLSDLELAWSERCVVVGQVSGGAGCIVALLDALGDVVVEWYAPNSDVAIADAEWWQRQKEAADN